MPNIRKMTDDKTATAVAMYKSGSTYDEIAMEMEVSPSCVVRVLKANGVKSRRRGSRNKVDLSGANAMVRLYERGMSTRSIASRTGVHQMTVLRHLKRKGVDTSRGSSRTQRISQSMLSMPI